MTRQRGTPRKIAKITRGLSKREVSSASVLVRTFEASFKPVSMTCSSRVSLCQHHWKCQSCWNETTKGHQWRRWILRWNWEVYRSKQYHRWVLKDEGVMIGESGNPLQVSFPITRSRVTALNKGNDMGDIVQTKYAFLNDDVVNWRIVRRRVW